MVSPPLFEGVEPPPRWKASSVEEVESPPLFVVEEVVDGEAEVPPIRIDPELVFELEVVAGVGLFPPI